MSENKEKQRLASSGMQIPDAAIERMARCMLPMIQRYYESEEGRRELSEWSATHPHPKGKTEQHEGV